MNKSPDFSEGRSPSINIEDDASINTRMSSSKSSTLYCDGQMFATNPISNDLKAIPSSGLRRASTMQVRVFDIDKRLTQANRYHFANQSEKITKSSSSIKSIDFSDNKKLESMYFDYEILSVSYISESYSNLESSDFSKVKHLTDGSNSHIYKGYLGQNQVILKVLKDKDSISQSALHEFNQEMSILSRIAHKNIVLLYGSGSLPSDSNPHLNRPLIVLEPLYGGTLSYHLKLKRSFHTVPFTELRYLRIAKELADALLYLHEQVHADCVIIHRDVNPDNIGFSRDGSVKLMDFGACVAVQRDTLGSSYTLSGGTMGVLRYMAPEAALNKPYNEKVDMYSYGLILYEIITGCSPFTGLNISKQINKFYEKVFQLHSRPNMEYDDFGRKVKINDNRVQQMIINCWSQLPAMRPAAREASELFTLLEAECADRKTSQSALSSAISSAFTKKDTI